MVPGRGGVAAVISRPSRRGGETEGWASTISISSSLLSCGSFGEGGGCFSPYAFSDDSGWAMLEAECDLGREW